MATILPIVGNLSSAVVCPTGYLPRYSPLAQRCSMSNRIRQLRDHQGLSRKALAEMAGTTANQLVKLENGDRRLSDHWAERLAGPLGVQPYELMLPEGVPQALRMVPMLGSVACGNWKEAVQVANRHVPTIFGGRNAFALEPDGDSMDKLLPQGGYIVVDPDQLALESGKAFVVMNGDGEATAKVYRADPPRLEPASNNPAHVAMLIGETPFTVIGRIVGVMSAV
ncbi:LexA family protein [Sphingomonas japonica]|nr:S24 family peptidase [Sphingomonas japonica]